MRLKIEALTFNGNSEALWATKLILFYNLFTNEGQIKNDSRAFDTWIVNQIFSWTHAPFNRGGLEKPRSKPLGGFELHKNRARRPWLITAPCALHLIKMPHAAKKLDEEGMGSCEPIPFVVLWVYCRARFACRDGRRTRRWLLPISSRTRSNSRETFRIFPSARL